MGCVTPGLPPVMWSVLPDADAVAVHDGRRASAAPAPAAPPGRPGLMWLRPLPPSPGLPRAPQDGAPDGSAASRPIAGPQGLPCK